MRPTTIKSLNITNTYESKNDTDSTEPINFYDYQKNVACI